MFGLDLSDVFTGGLGLLVAWWFVPQPAFMRRLYKRWNIAYYYDTIRGA